MRKGGRAGAEGDMCMSMCACACALEHLEAYQSPAELMHRLCCESCHQPLTPAPAAIGHQAIRYPGTKQSSSQAFALN